jgi:prephenate dehydratase
MFNVDIQGHIKDSQVAKAIDMLSSHARFLRLLGSYPAAE